METNHFELAELVIPDAEKGDRHPPSTWAIDPPGPVRERQFTESSIDRSSILQASWIIEDASAGRAILTSLSQKQRMVFKFYMNRMFRGFLIFCCVLHCVLTVFEYSASGMESVKARFFPNISKEISAPSTSRRLLAVVPCLPADQPDGKTPAAYTAQCLDVIYANIPNWCRFVEIALVSMYILDLGLKWYSKGWRSFIRGGWNRLTVFLVVTIFIDLAITLSNINRSVPRFSRPGRAVLLVCYSRSFRKHIVATLKTLRDIKNLLGVISLFLIIASLIAIMLYRAFCPNCDGGRSKCCSAVVDDGRLACDALAPFFDRYFDSLVTIFVLFTTENFPDLYREFVSLSIFSSIFFVIFSICGTFLLLSVLLAVVFDSFKNIKTREIQREIDSQDIALLQAFKLLCRPGSSTVDFGTFERVLRTLMPNASAEHISIYFAFLDADGDENIDALEFLDVTKILYLDLEESRRGALIGRLPKCFRGNSFLQKVVQHTAFQLTGDMVILINAICMIIYVSMHDTDPPCESAAFPIDCGIQSNLDNLEYGFVAFYILELLVRCLAWGAAALQSGWLWLDLIVVLTSITSIIVNTPAGISLASAVRLLRMLRLIRFLRIFFVLEKFKVILRTLAQIIPQLVSFFCFVLTMLYIFSVIAIWSFQCRYVSYTSIIDFDTLGGALSLLFQVLIVSNWQDIMFQAIQQTGTKAVSLYFIFFILVIVWVLLNLIISMIIEVYTKNIVDLATKKDDDVPSRRVVSPPAALSMTRAQRSRNRNGVTIDNNPGDMVTYRMKLRMNKDRQLAMQLSGFDVKKHREMEDRLLKISAESGIDLMACVKEREANGAEAKNNAGRIGFRNARDIGKRKMTATVAVPARALMFSSKMLNLRKRKQTVSGPPQATTSQPPTTPEHGGRLSLITTPDAETAKLIKKKSMKGLWRRLSNHRGRLSEGRAETPAAEAERSPTSPPSSDEGLAEKGDVHGNGSLRPDEGGGAS